MQPRGQGWAQPGALPGEFPSCPAPPCSGEGPQGGHRGFFGGILERGCKAGRRDGVVWSPRRGQGGPSCLSPHLLSSLACPVHHPHSQHAQFGAASFGTAPGISTRGFPREILLAGGQVACADRSVLAVPPQGQECQNVPAVPECPPSVITERGALSANLKLGARRSSVVHFVLISCSFHGFLSPVRLHTWGLKGGVVFLSCFGVHGALVLLSEPG